MNKGPIPKCRAVDKIQNTPQQMQARRQENQEKIGDETKQKVRKWFTKLIYFYLFTFTESK